jgi:hypothetical protein
MKNNRVTLNIGLGNNPIGFEAMKSWFAYMYGAKSFEAMGKWEDADEKTAVISFATDMTEFQMILMVRLWCISYGQTAIGMKYNDVGTLVYRDGYIGNKCMFDDQFFLDLKDRQ